MLYSNITINPGINSLATLTGAGSLLNKQVHFTARLVHIFDQLGIESADSSTGITFNDSFDHDFTLVSHHNDVFINNNTGVVQTIDADIADFVNIALEAVVVAAATPINCTEHVSLTVQVDELSGGDTIAFEGSTTPAGTNYPLDVTTVSGGSPNTNQATITANGIYTVNGANGLYIQYTKTGSASTPTVTVSASH